MRAAVVALAFVACLALLPAGVAAKDGRPPGVEDNPHSPEASPDASPQLNSPPRVIVLPPPLPVTRPSAPQPVPVPAPQPVPVPVPQPVPASPALPSPVVPRASPPRAKPSPAPGAVGSPPGTTPSGRRPPPGSGTGAQPPGATPGSPAEASPELQVPPLLAVESDSASGASANVGAIVGGVLGGLALLIVAAVVVSCCWGPAARRRRHELAGAKGDRGAGGEFTMMASVAPDGGRMVKFAVADDVGPTKKLEEEAVTPHPSMLSAALDTDATSLGETLSSAGGALTGSSFASRASAGYVYGYSASTPWRADAAGGAAPLVAINAGGWAGPSPADAQAVSAAGPPVMYAARSAVVVTVDRSVAGSTTGDWSSTVRGSAPSAVAGAASVTQRLCGASKASGIVGLLAQLESVRQGNGVLLNRYLLDPSSQQRVGGQGVVLFASSPDGGQEKFALKFFLDGAAFANERAHYANPSLAHVLPPIHAVYDNDAIMVLNRPLPPMVVTERGEALDEWARRLQPNSSLSFANSMQIIAHLVQRVGELHNVGLAHRDLKPGNIILLPSRNEWTLIDYGSAAVIGTNAPLSLSLAYAAPETVLALLEGRGTVVADSAVDVWALGVVAYELLTHTRVFPSNRGFVVEETMAGRALLPWEDTNSSSYKHSMSALGFMRPMIMRMLRRNPGERVALRDVEAAWNSVLRHADDATLTIDSEHATASSVGSGSAHAQDQSRP